MKFLSQILILSLLNMSPIFAGDELPNENEESVEEVKNSCADFLHPFLVIIPLTAILLGDHLLPENPVCPYTILFLLSALDVKLKNKIINYLTK